MPWWAGLPPACAARLLQGTGRVRQCTILKVARSQLSAVAIQAQPEGTQLARAADKCYKCEYIDLMITALTCNYSQPSQCHRCDNTEQWCTAAISCSAPSPRQSAALQPTTLIISGHAHPN